MTTHSAWVIAGIVVFAVVFSILLALNKAPSPHPVWVLPTGVLIIVAALSWAGQWEFKHSLTLLLVLTFVVVAIAATYGVWHRRNSASDPEHPTILEPVTHFEDTVTPGSNER